MLVCSQKLSKFFLLPFSKANRLFNKTAKFYCSKYYKKSENLGNKEQKHFKNLFNQKKSTKKQTFNQNDVDNSEFLISLTRQLLKDSINAKSDEKSLILFLDKVKNWINYAKQISSPSMMFNSKLKYHLVKKLFEINNKLRIDTIYFIFEIIELSNSFYQHEIKVIFEKIIYQSKNLTDQNVKILLKKFCYYRLQVNDQLYNNFIVSSLNNLKLNNINSYNYLLFVKCFAIISINNLLPQEKINEINPNLEQENIDFSKLKLIDFIFLKKLLEYLINSNLENNILSFLIQSKIIYKLLINSKKTNCWLF